MREIDRQVKAPGKAERWFNPAAVMIATVAAIVATLSSLGLNFHVFGDPVVAQQGGATPLFIPEAPRRPVDTRAGLGGETLSPNEVRSIELGALSGEEFKDIQAVLVNITITNPSGSGFIKVGSPNDPTPETAVLAFVAGQTVSNLAISRVTNDGVMNLYLISDGSTDVIVDLVGYVPND